MEIWDIIDESGNKTGGIVERGKLMKPGEYHLVVEIWIRNNKGQYLVTKRSPDIPYPNLWAATGGSAIIGEDSLTAALRETKEEIGLALSPEKGRLIIKQAKSNSYINAWLFNDDFEINSLVFQPEEVVDAKWVTTDEIRKMIEEGMFIDIYDYLDKLFAEK